MRHATQETLDALEPLLDRIREIGALKERSRGVFYRKSRAFLHFHEDAEGLFADIQSGGAWQRLSLQSDTNADELLQIIRQSVAS